MLHSDNSETGYVFGPIVCLFQPIVSSCNYICETGMQGNEVDCDKTKVELNTSSPWLRLICKTFHFPPSVVQSTVPNSPSAVQCTCSSCPVTMAVQIPPVLMVLPIPPFLIVSPIPVVLPVPSTSVVLPASLLC